MLYYHKARPKRKRLLTISKDSSSKNLIVNLSRIYHDIVYSKFGQALLKSIPVLSIFVLLGIMGYAIVSPSNLVNILSLGLGESDGEVYAADSTSNTSSLIIDNGELSSGDGNNGSGNTTTEGNITYSSHTVQVNASNIEGYSLKISGPTGLSGDTEIKGANNKTPANMDNNTWGYAWTDNTSAANNSLYYQSFDNNNDQVLASSSSASSVNLNNKLVFAVKFGSDAVAGHYKANVKLNLTVTPKTVATYNYSITYNANGGSGSAPAKQTAESTNTSHNFVTLNQGSLTRSSYNFLGWSTSSDATFASYAAGATIGLSSSSPAITLYAIWQYAPTWDNITTMQEMTSEVCANSNVSVGTSRTLIDDRDDTEYTIRKLVDGNCWMIDNLKLDLSSYNLTSENSDVTTTKNAGWASKITDSSWTYSNSATRYSPNGLGDANYNSSYGYYYSWCAATAGTCTNSGDASSSICPKGWKLPKGGSSGGDFYTLYQKNTSAASWTTDNGFGGRWLGASSASAGGAFFIAAGRATPTGLDRIGYAFYWSRTAITSTDNKAYYLFFQSANIYPNYDYDQKYNGNSVRCIAYSS